MTRKILVAAAGAAMLLAAPLAVRGQSTEALPPTRALAPAASDSGIVQVARWRTYRRPYGYGRGYYAPYRYRYYYGAPRYYGYYGYNPRYYGNYPRHYGYYPRYYRGYYAAPQLRVYW